MAKKSSLKKSLLVSALSLTLSASMLVGTTFAWFTDSVTNAGNKIQAGTLDIDLYDVTTGTEVEITETSDALFEYERWEPGYKASKVLKVKNNGTLALKFCMDVRETASYSTSSADIRDVIEVWATTPKATYAATDYEWQTDYTYCGTLTQMMAEEDGAIHGTLLEGESAYQGIVLKMSEEAGNEYQGAMTGFDIVLRATQFTYESDSYDDQYDASATYPKVKTVNVPAGTTEPTPINAGKVTVSVPAGAEEGLYTIEVNDYKKTENGAETTVSYNIEFMKDGASVNGSGVPYEVAILVAPEMNVTKVLHDGNEVTDFTYDLSSGIVKFTTTGFSPFAVTYQQIVGEGVKIENSKITSGLFTENPVKYDPALGEKNSEYIAINYEKGGQKYYIVSKRATTVVVGAPDTVYTAENGNYNVTTSNGSLYSIISGLQNNEYSKVYLLPGTYIEATTINVCSSMEIAGLGDKDSVKVVKGESNGSNQHLFNCNGQKADYIEVTIRDLYLDANALNYDKNGKARDNAAVQSIRKTKVKCYNLTIYKEKNSSVWDRAAFYVNGNNDVGGVKYTAYMYVENCSYNLNQVFSTKATVKYAHYNVTHNGGTEYKSSYKLTAPMAADDWWN